MPCPRYHRQPRSAESRIKPVTASRSFAALRKTKRVSAVHVNPPCRYVPAPEAPYFVQPQQTRAHSPQASSEEFHAQDSKCVPALRFFPPPREPPRESPTQAQAKCWDRHSPGAPRARPASVAREPDQYASPHSKHQSPFELAAQ